MRQVHQDLRGQPRRGRLLACGRAGGPRKDAPIRGKGAVDDVHAMDDVVDKPAESPSMQSPPVAEDFAKHLLDNYHRTPLTRISLIVHN